MYYLEEQPFLDRKGEQVEIGDQKFTTATMLETVISAWQPDKDNKPSMLSPAQIRVWQKLMGDLEDGPENGYLALEDDRFTLAKSLAPSLMQGIQIRVGNRMTPLAHYVPQMEDLLAEATQKKPEADADKDKQKEPVAVPV